MFRLLAAVTIATALAWRGAAKGKLSRSGAAAAFIVGLCAFACDVPAGVTCIAFYLLGSAMTKRGAERKRKLEAEYDLAAARSATQVAANALPACVALVLAKLMSGSWSSLEHWDLAQDLHLTAWQAYARVFAVSYWCVCAGDTASSEMGILAQGQPRLITAPWRRVAPGVNGAVTWAGLKWAGLAGGLVGGVYVLAKAAVAVLTKAPMVSAQSAVLAVAACAGIGLAGSMLDSVLGATVQATWWDDDAKLVISDATAARQRGLKRMNGVPLLSNDGVNVVAASIVAAGAVLTDTQL